VLTFDVIMLRFAALGFLLIYLVSFTEFREVLRLPLLVEHYGEHKSQVSEMSFLEFLIMHYETDVAHDDRDMRLPFKDSSHSISLSLVTLPNPKMCLSGPIEINDAAVSFFYLQHEPKLLTADIFQPPRL
jgi:hypothetical protein